MAAAARKPDDVIHWNGLPLGGVNAPALDIPRRFAALGVRLPEPVRDHFETVLRLSRRYDEQVSRPAQRSLTDRLMAGEDVDRDDALAVTADAALLTALDGALAAATERSGFVVSRHAAALVTALREPFTTAAERLSDLGSRLLPGDTAETVLGRGETALAAEVLTVGAEALSVIRNVAAVRRAVSPSFDNPASPVSRLAWLCDWQEDEHGDPVMLSVPMTSTWSDVSRWARAAADYGLWLPTPAEQADRLDYLREREDDSR